MHSKTILLKPSLVFCRWTTRCPVVCSRSAVEAWLPPPEAVEANEVSHVYHFVQAVHNSLTRECCNIDTIAQFQLIAMSDERWAEEFELICTLQEVRKRRVRTRIRTSRPRRAAMRTTVRAARRRSRPEEEGAGEIHRWNKEMWGNNGRCEEEGLGLG